MCAPAAIATGGLGIAQSALGFMGQNSQAAYQNANYAQAAQASALNYRQQVNAANLRMEQNSQSADQQAQQLQTQALQAEGHANAAAAGSGVAGNSVAELHNDLARVDALNQNAVTTNLQMQQQQLVQDEQGIRAGAQSRINSAMPPPQTGSLAGALIGGATSVFSAYNQYQQQNGSGPYNANGAANPGASWFYRPLHIPFSG